VGLAGLAVFALAAAQPAAAQLVSNGFEDGTTQGWGPRGGVTVTSSTDVAHTGTHSLKTLGRTASWNGPALDLRTVLPRNATYRVTAWVRLVAGEPTSNLKLTLQRTPVGGSTTFTQVTSPVAASDSAWVQIQGNLALPADDNSDCTLYLESDDATSAYYIDDFTISALSGSGCPEPLDQSGFFTDFESGANQGWTSRGSAVLTNTTTAAYNGSHSLAVTGRGASWQGPSYNVQCKLNKGSKYLISAWVRLLPGEPASQLRISLQATLGGAASFYTVVGNTNVTDGGWVNLSTEYTFALDADQLSLYIESASGTASFYVDDALVEYEPPVPIQTDIPSLKDVLEPYFHIGAAIEPAQLSGQQAELLVKHFSQYTAGNAMKWDATEPSEGVFNFTRADALANFARSHGMRMRGHTLVWHSQVPAWVFQDAAGNPLQPGNPDHRALLLQRLQRHIQTLVTRYSDIVDSWDVVNEVIDPAQSNGLRNSPWLQIIGPEYIDYAFQWAHQYAPNAALFINDYSTTDAPKRAALQKEVQGLLDRGIPVNGVGHQMHINVQWPSVDDIRTTLKLFAGMGLMNEITEMDMSVYTNSTDTAEPTADVLALQGYRYRDVFNVYRELHSIINSVTLWGLGDDSSWLKTFPIKRDDKPLPFDEQLQAKPAYWGIVDPTKLPVVPKSLNITQVDAWSPPQPAAFWDAVAAQPLTSANNSGSWAQFEATWSNNALNLWVTVTDGTQSSADTVDVYLGTAHYRFSGFGRQRPNGADALERPRQGGYELLATIPASEALAVGGTQKFDIRVTDSATGQQLSWSDTKQDQDSDLSKLGTLKLLPAKQVLRTLRGTPTIDGVIDAAWSKSDSVQTQKFVLGSSGATAVVRTLWDDGHIYVLAEVTDPVLSHASANAWEQDSVELFVDANNGQTTAYQGDDAQYRVNYLNQLSFGGAATASNIVSATKTTANGYIVEAAITVPGLGSASTDRDGTYVGFDVQVNDDGAGNGVRSSVATWNDATGQDYLDTSNFGVLQLVRTGR